MDMRADAAARHKVYDRLMIRNRLVSVLRIAVPLLGVFALVALAGQIYLASLGSQFGVGAITATSDTITVQTPEYAGVFSNGTAYRISARAAEAATANTDRIGLFDAALTTTRPDNFITDIRAPEALLDTATETVVIEGPAIVSNSAGTTGVVNDSVFDYPGQLLVGNGPVTIDYADGMRLTAEGMTYDAKRLVWTFTRATVTLPSTPGAESDP